VEIVVLASGSSGNAVYVVSGGDAILVDVGISATSVHRRLAAAGHDLERLRAVVVTHEHTDHMKGARVLLKRHPVPLWATQGTWGGLDVRTPGGGTLRSGVTVSFGGLRITPVATSHDAAEPVAVLVDDGSHRVAVCTDTGVVTPLLEERLRGCNLLMLEANHDADLLRHGSYPWHLKQRIASRHGHLANHQAQEALDRMLTRDLRGVVALHISEENNEPSLAEACLATVVNGSVPVSVAGRHHMVRVVLDGDAVTMERLGAPPARGRTAR